MSDGSNDFYVRDVDFSSAYNPLQAPFHLAYVAATSGFAPATDLGDLGNLDDFTYCDLGCGNGLTLNGLAAVHASGRFIGVDFNSDHIEQARQLARAAGISNTEYVESSFSDLDQHDLPQFDFIAMNGIYSWLHPDVVKSVIGFVGRHLKPGGLFVVEYLTLPGSAAAAPMWNLMRALTSHVEGGPLARADKGLEALADLRKNNARYFVSNPRQAGMIDSMHARRDQNDGIAQWMAHASLADNWHPKYFTEVAAELAPAGLGFVGSVNLPLNDLALAIPPKLRKMFDGVDDTGQIELLKDFILDQSQRTDVFVKDAEPDAAGARKYLADHVQLARLLDRDQAGQALSRLGRQVYGGAKADYRCVIETVYAGDRDRSLGELVDDPALADIETEDRWTILTRLISSGQYGLRETNQPTPEAAPSTTRWRLNLDYNRIRMERTLSTLENNTLVCTSGAGIPLHGLDALNLWALLELDPDDRVASIRSRLLDHDELITVAGRPTSPDWITDTQIEDGLRQFEQLRIPVLARLGVIEPAKG